MAIKLVCDLCGNDATDAEFVLPEYEDCAATKNGKTEIDILLYDRIGERLFVDFLDVDDICWNAKSELNDIGIIVKLSHKLYNDLYNDEN